MADCPKCGLVNPGAVDFCPNPQCRAYLGWTSAAAAPQSTDRRPVTGAESAAELPRQPAGPSSPSPRPASAPAAAGPEPARPEQVDSEPAEPEPAEPTSATPPPRRPATAPAVDGSASSAVGGPVSVAPPPQRPTTASPAGSAPVGDCPKCGLVNPGAVDFCPNPQCRTYLGWASAGASLRIPVQRPASEVQTTSARPADASAASSVAGLPVREPAASPGQKRGVSVTMETAELTVDPGSQITTTVTVRNLGTRVEEFQLILQGPGAAFASITPDTLSVYPDLEQRAVVRFAPLRAPQSTAGVTTFEVVARSAVHSDVRDVVRGRLTITPFQDLKAVLTPDVSRGRKPGRHLVSVTNGGNTPVHAQLAFKDQDGVLTFEPQQGTATLEPGDKADLPTLINGPRRWFGRTERLAFSALVTPPEPHPPITLNGTRQQTPIFPWWMPTAAIAILALAIGLAALLKPGQATVPVVGQLDEPQAVELLKEARYLPESVPQKDNDVPQGKAIGTEPQGGAELKPGERVKLFVSSGPEENNPLAPVPPVAQQPPGQGGSPSDEKPASDQNPPADKEAADKGAADKAAADKAAADKAAAEKPIKIPDLKGSSVADATAALEKLGLTANAVNEHSNAVPDGKVLSTKPGAASEAKPGSEVAVAVAQNTRIDLIAVADQASWKDQDKRNLEVEDTDKATGTGVVRTTANDGSSVLVTTPGPGGSITGVYTLKQPIISGDHLRAQIGLLTDADKFKVLVKADGTPINTMIKTVRVNNIPFQELDADLSSAKDATKIEITVQDTGRTAQQAEWHQLRLASPTG